jgi:phosphotransferase system enzyme I (PtsI)
MQIINGVSIFDGIAMGGAFVVPERVHNSIPKYALRPQDIEKDWARFLSAKEKAEAALKAELACAAGDGRLILETHRMMLGDSVFMSGLRAFFEQCGQNIEYALDCHVAASAQALRDAGNAALAERADDIADVFGRVMQELLGNEAFDFGKTPAGAIVVARKLQPSEALALFKRRPAGLCLAEGGASGHLAILAREERVPAVFAARDAHTAIRTGNAVILDGAKARVYVEPDEKTAAAFRRRQKEDARFFEFLRTARDKPCVTRDGKRIFLFANIGKSEEARQALDEGADGVGLFRTEFLFMDEESRRGRSVPEDVQFEAYRAALETMKRKPVVIRTLDAGGDKFVEAVQDDKSLRRPPEENPLLGERSIRLTLAHPDLLKKQLRALYRASVYGDLRIMLPLVVSLAEIRAVRALAAEVKNRLASENIPFNRRTPVGIMVETPAAALASDAFAPYSDFFSIGTNDLTQYSLGIDRENPAVSALYDEFHLSVLRLVKTTADNALAAGVPVSVCGEMAGTPEGAVFLAGAGINTLSMASPLIPRIKHTLAQFSSEELAEIARAALAARKDTSSHETVKKLCRGKK